MLIWDSVLATFPLGSFWSLALSLTSWQKIWLNTHLTATNCCLTVLVPWNSMLLTPNCAPLFLYWKPVVTYDSCILPWEMVKWNKGILLHEINCMSDQKFLPYCLLLPLRSFFIFLILFPICQIFFLILDNWSVLEYSLPLVLIIQSTHPSSSTLQYVLLKLFQKQ